MEPGKNKVRSWDELRAELQRVAGETACEQFDRAVAEGRKVTAIKLLRDLGIELYDN